MDIINQILALLGNKQSQTPPPQVHTAQSAQTGWKPASDGKGYLPVYNSPAPLKTIPTKKVDAIPSAIQQARNPNLGKYQMHPSVTNALNIASKQYNVPTSLLQDIALQESSFNPSLVNTTPAGKEAGNPTGLFQFTDSTWNNILSAYNKKPGMTLNLPNDNRMDPVTNALAAAYLIKNGQLGRWDASKDVWGQYYKPEELKPYYSQTIGRN